MVTNNRFQRRTRIGASHVVNRPRVPAEPRRSSGPAPDKHARHFSARPMLSMNRRADFVRQLNFDFWHEQQRLATLSLNQFPESRLADCSDKLIARTRPADLCGLPKSAMIPVTAVHVGPRRTNKTVRTIDCTSDRDSALSKWMIARAIEVNRDVLRLQRLTPMPVDFPVWPMPKPDRRADF